MVREKIKELSDMLKGEFSVPPCVSSNISRNMVDRLGTQINYLFHTLSVTEIIFFCAFFNFFNLGGWSQFI